VEQYLLSSRARHSSDSDICPTGNSNAIILVLDNSVRQNDVIARGEIESIGVVCSSLASTGGVWCVAGGVVEGETGKEHAIASCHVEAVDGPVLDVQVRDDTINHVVENNKVVRSVMLASNRYIEVDDVRTSHFLRLILHHPNKLLRSRQ